MLNLIQIIIALPELKHFQNKYTNLFLLIVKIEWLIDYLNVITKFELALDSIEK